MISSQSVLRTLTYPITSLSKMSSSSSSTNHPNFKVSVADWDKTSTNYAQNISRAPMSIPITRLIALLDTFSPFSAATRILDVGCGPGNGISAIISSFHGVLPSHAQLLATDFSSGMVEIVTRTRASKLEELQEDTTEKQAWEKVQPLVLNAMDLSPLLDASISHIIANFVFFMTSIRVFASVTPSRRMRMFILAPRTMARTPQPCRPPQLPWIRKANPGNACYSHRMDYSRGHGGIVEESRV
jgi:SAM-dependent methyltransferase